MDNTSGGAHPVGSMRTVVSIYVARACAQLLGTCVSWYTSSIKLQLRREDSHSSGKEMCSSQWQTPWLALSVQSLFGATGLPACPARRRRPAAPTGPIPWTSMNVTQAIDNIHGTGLETCHVSALNACKTKRQLRVTGIRTSQVSEPCCLYMSSTYGILYLKDRSGSCGTILKKPWGL